MYVIRKYVKAVSVKQALRKEPTTAVHDVWISEDWSKEHLAHAIGFDDGMTEEEDESSYT